MPQVDKVKHPSKAPAFIAVGVAVVLVAVVVGAVFMMKSAPKPIATSTVLTTAADKAFSNNYDGAIAMLNDQLPKAKNNDEKLEIYLALGADYEGKNDNRLAYEAYKKAEAIKPGYGVNEAIARTAEAIGDKDVAIDYLKRNRELIKSGKAYQHNDALSGIEESITRLGGTL